METQPDAVRRHTAARGATSFYIGTLAQPSPNAVVLRAMALTAQSPEHDPRFATPRAENELKDKAKVANVYRVVLENTRIRKDLAAPIYCIRMADTPAK